MVQLSRLDSPASATEFRVIMEQELLLALGVLLGFMLGIMAGIFVAARIDD